MHLPSLVLTQHMFTAAPTVITTDPEGRAAIPLDMKYSSVIKQGQLLAIADEDGYVSIVDTSEELPGSLRVADSEPSQVKAQWMAHNNSVFQLEWSKVRSTRCGSPATCVHCCSAGQTGAAVLQGDRQLLTAAADFTCLLYTSPSPRD